MKKRKVCQTTPLRVTNLHMQRKDGFELTQTPNVTCNKCHTPQFYDFEAAAKRDVPVTLEIHVCAQCSHTFNPHYNTMKGGAANE